MAFSANKKRGTATTLNKSGVQSYHTYNDFVRPKKKTDKPKPKGGKKK